MERFVEIFQELVVKSLEYVYQFAINTGPKIALSLLVILIGWVFAVLFKKIITKLLKAFGFDVISEKTGIKGFLERGGIQKRPSLIIGMSFYWIIVFGALIMVFNVLEMPFASQFIVQAILYIPKIMISLVFLALGIFLGRFIARFVEASARLAKISFYGVLSRIAQYIIVGLAIMLALEYLGVSTAVIIQYALVIFIVVPLIVTLVFIVGGREIILSFLAGRILQKEYKKGDIITFDSISGKLEAINLITTKISNQQEELIIPNSELVKKVVKKTSSLSQ